MYYSLAGLSGLGQVQVPESRFPLAVRHRSIGRTRTAAARPGPGYESRSDLRVQPACEAGHRPRRPGPLGDRLIRTGLQMLERSPDCQWLGLPLVSDSDSEHQRRFRAVNGVLGNTVVC